MGYPKKSGYQHNKELPTTAGCSIFASANIWRKNIWTNAPAFDESEVGAIWPRLVSATRHEHTANDVTLNPYMSDFQKLVVEFLLGENLKITERNFYVQIIPPKIRKFSSSRISCGFAIGWLGPKKNPSNFSQALQTWMRFPTFPTKNPAQVRSVSFAASREVALFCHHFKTWPSLGGGGWWVFLRISMRSPVKQPKFESDFFGCSGYLLIYCI